MKGLRDDDVVRCDPPCYRAHFSLSVTQHLLAPADLPQAMDSQSSGQSPLSPHFNAPSHLPSPPAASGVRRHQSLTYGTAVSGPRQMPTTSLRRRGTHQGQSKQLQSQPAQPHSPTPPDAEEDDNPEDGYDDYDEAYYNLPPASQPVQPVQAQYQTSPRVPPSLWGPNANAGEWRIAPGSDGFNNTAIDDVNRALEKLEINQTQPYPSRSPMNFSNAQSSHPPRFNADQGSPNPMTDFRSANGNGHSIAGGNSRSRQLPELEGRKTPSGGVAPGSGSTYGASVNQLVSQQQQSSHQRSFTERDDRLVTHTGTGSRDQTRLSRSSNPNMHSSYQQHNKMPSVPDVPAIPPQYLNQQHQQQQSQQQQQVLATRLGNAPFGQTQSPSSLNQQNAGFLTSAIDVPSLIAAKGYNPSNFDIRPQCVHPRALPVSASCLTSRQQARYFVIKSYTEDDVHKSLKYEIWSSTDPGNKRLDKAFKETAGRGPIYLFFSVNAR